MMPADPSQPPAPAIKGSILFHYYDDLDAAARWYQEILGLEVQMREDWLVLLRLGPASTLGLVDAVNGSHKPPRGAGQNAMLSIETDEIDAWHARFKALGLCPPDAALVPGCRGRTREFTVRDPGNYVVEFFQWIAPPA